MRTIEFKKNEYDPQIDYIKGICILFVIWTHCINRYELGIMLYPYWGDTAVPIFLLIQVFHYFKKGVELRIPKLLKLWKRIILPFVIMIALMFIVQFYIYYDVTNGVFSPSFYWDKRGPGSYYIFIYLELAFVIPLFVPLIKKLSIKWLLVVFVIISQLIEFVTCVTYCPDNIYRITFFRYTFLIFIGYLLATKGLNLNSKTIIGSIISVIFIFLFSYTEVNMEPLFCTHLDLWPICHWICYIYIAYLFIAFLKYTYTILSNRYAFITNFIEKIGKFSYEIYLFQIFYYATLSIYVGDTLTHIGVYSIQRILYFLISSIICITPIICFKTKSKC